MRPRNQRQRKMSEERILAAKAEVQRFLDVNVIREIIYPEWLANVVLVPKKNGKMRMCIDFTDLNKACIKDSFPLLRIDASVDKTTTARDSHCWTVCWDIIKSGSRKKTKAKQASQLRLGLTAIPECPKVLSTSGKPSLE